MLSHQRHPRGNPLIRTYMERDFRKPKDFASFLYVGQVLQATVIKYAAEAHRRAHGRTTGAACTGSSMTAGRSPPGRASTTTAAGRRCTTPRDVSSRRCWSAPSRRRTRCASIGVSDRRADAPARLLTRVVDMEGRERWRQERDVTVKALTSAPALSVAKSELLKGLDPKQVVLVTELRSGSEVLSRNLLYFAKTKDLALLPPELAVVVTPHGDGATIQVTARRLARAVWLSTPDQGGVDGGFSDNFFDLLAGETATVVWTPGAATPPGTAAKLGSVLRATSVRDTY